MIYPVLAYIVLQAMLVCAETSKPDNAVITPECSLAMKWDVQTQDMMEDIQSVDKLVGLSPPARAVAYMLAHLNDQYMVGTQNKPVTDCMLSQGFDLFYNLFNQDSYCAIAFPFSRADVAFKDPGPAEKSQSSFGLIPLHIEKLYKSLRASTGPLKSVFTGGDSAEDVASDTQWLFTLATRLQMTKQSVFDYKGQNPDGVEQVLLRCATSPVFLVVRETLLILTQPIDSDNNRWSGFDPAKGPQEGQFVLDIREDLESSPDTTFIMYHRDGAGLADLEAEKPEKCDYKKTAWSNSERVKLFPFKS